MEGIKDLKTLLKNLDPVISEKEYVFCLINDTEFSFASLYPICIFKENEGVTVVLERHIALNKGLTFNGIFKQITLQVHSSLHAVGLTAVVSKALADNGISANIIAAYYHDHIFVPSNRSEEALRIIKSRELILKDQSCI